MNVIPLERPRESCMARMRAPGEFPDGWAMLPFRGKPHWFRFVVDRFTGGEDELIATTLCGRAWTAKATAQIGEPGNFPRCKQCIAALRKRNN